MPRKVDRGLIDTENRTAIRSAFTGAHWFAIGTANSNQFYFNGAIDDVRIYNRVLSASEVNRLYLMGK